MTIRPFEPTDYPQLARVGDMAYSDADGVPMLPMSAESIAEQDASQVPPCRRGRWVVEIDGRLIGAGEYDQSPTRFDPRRFWMDVYVLPDHQGRGWGSRLYDVVSGEMSKFDPLSARCALREDAAAGRAFAEARGWVEESRSWESFLDLALFVPPEGKPTPDELGVEIRTLAELAGDPNRNRKLHDLVWEIDQDVPELEDATRDSFGAFVTERIEYRRMLPDFYFVATYRGRYVGVSYYMSDDSDPLLVRTALTGVSRERRGRGLAWALKTHGLEALRLSPYRRVRTVNESTNRAMLTVNEQLGFVKRPAWLDMVKHFEAS